MVKIQKQKQNLFLLSSSVITQMQPKSQNQTNNLQYSPKIATPSSNHKTYWSQGTQLNSHTTRLRPIVQIKPMSNQIWSEFTNPKGSFCWIHPMHYQKETHSPNQARTHSNPPNPNTMQPKLPNAHRASTNPSLWLFTLKSIVLRALLLLLLLHTLNSFRKRVQIVNGWVVAPLWTQWFHQLIPSNQPPMTLLL